MEAKLLINNQILDSSAGTKITAISPWDDTVLGSLEAATADQARETVQKAATAFSTWRYSSISTRLELLTKVVTLLQPRIDELGELLSKEIGRHAKTQLP